ITSGTAALAATNRREKAESKRTGLDRTARSIVRTKIQSCVQWRNLLAITVEHQGRATMGLSDALLGGLAPSGVIDLGIDVGKEAIFARRVSVPARGRHLRHE